MNRKREVVLLVGLLVVLAALIVYQWRQMGAADTQAAMGNAAGPSGPRGAGRAVSAAPAVKLEALQEARKQPSPPPSERNLFRFQPKAPPPPPPSARAAAQAPVVPTGPPPPPPPPPITLKFIGVVTAAEQKLAVLSDPATKDVFYGREGDIVDGRFRILRIGVESVEMAYVDGRGRQSIRLSGS